MIADPNLIKACETFSEGDAESIVESIDKGVTWEIIGHHSIQGLPALLEFCREMLPERPVFQNRCTTVGENRIVVEGRETKEGGVFYCDVYTVSNELIREIRSYCLCPES